MHDYETNQRLRKGLERAEILILLEYPSPHSVQQYIY